MKKHNTGYFTPQAGRNKNAIKHKRSGSNEDLSLARNLSDTFFEELMNCPVKRQMILDLINCEMDNTQTYKRNQAEKGKGKVCASPLSKLKRKQHCESPTALLRRRALQQQNHKHASENQNENKSDCSNRSSSRQSTSSSSSSSTPFNKLLERVTAFVEIKSKDQDRSSGVKILLKSMGATVRDTFTRDVTHVIFKDGSFTTYQKAKLMNIHLVSILWVRAVMDSNAIVPEKEFPALGTEAYNHNVSSFCSQLQKEYEDIIRDELRRSLATGTPLPSRQTLIDRRRTMTSALSQEFSSSEDKEVQKILNPRRKTYNFVNSQSSTSTKQSYDILTDDDSDLSPMIDGSVVKTHSKLPNVVKDNEGVNLLEQLEKSHEELTTSENLTSVVNNAAVNEGGSAQSSMELTDNIPNSENVKESNNRNTLSDSIYCKHTPKLKRNKSERYLLKGPQSYTPNDSVYKRKTKQLNKSHISSSSKLKRISEPVTNVSKSSATNFSIVELSDQYEKLQVLSKNTVNTYEGKNIDNIPKVTSSTVTEKSSSTNMSSLRISSDKEIFFNKVNETDAVSSSMSALLIIDSSKDKSNSSSSSINSIERNNNIKDRPLLKGTVSLNASNSFNPIDPDNILSIKKVLEMLGDSPLKEDNITKRRKDNVFDEKRVYNTRSKSSLSSDSDLNKNCSSGSPPKKAKTNASVATSKDMTKQDDKYNTNKEMDYESKSKKAELYVQLTSENFDVRNKLCTTANLTKTKISRTAPKSKATVSDDLLGNYKNNGIKGNTNRTKRSLFNKSYETESSGSDKKTYRTRKLYNPDESIKEILADDQKERQQKRINTKKQNSDGVVFNSNIVTISPNTLLTAKAKVCLEQTNIDIQSILYKESEESESNAKPNKTRMKKKVKQIIRDSYADEQQQLAAEFVNKKTSDKSNTEAAKKKRTQISKIRKSARLSQFQKQKSNLNSSMTSSDENDIVSVTPLINRRSSVEFQRRSQVNSNRKLKIDKKKPSSIVCTKLHKEEVQVFNQIVKKLGGFVIEDEVSNKTTHLVVGEPKRTINMLRAMVRGCWIVKHEWLLRSLEERKWLSEEDYEELDFSPVVQQSRLQRQAFGSSYTMDIFQDCGPIYIAKGSIPRCSDLRELVVLCKGVVVSIKRNATIIVGEYVEGVKCVKETWILDSITFNKRMPLKKYIIPSTSAISTAK